MLNLVSIFSFILLLSSLWSCNPKKVDNPVEVKNRGRFTNSPDKPKPTNPGNSDLDLSHSSVVINTQKLLLGGYAVATFEAKDANGDAIVEDGLSVTFQLEGNGTASATFGATNDDGRGIYSAILTATGVGSSNRIEVLVNGNAVVALRPSIEIAVGPFYRDITLDIATDQVEYQAQVILNTSNFDYSKVGVNGDDIRFYEQSNNLPFYIEKWDTSGESLIWVKIANANVSTIRMYYGDNTLAAASSQESAFTYDAAKEAYVELSSSAGTRNMKISSFIDNNTVTVESNTGSNSITLPVQTSTDFNNTVQGPISVTGPISGRYDNSSRGIDTVAPKTFSFMMGGYPKSRGSDEWDLYNPNTSVANVTITNYDSSGNNLGDTSFSINPGSFHHQNFDVSKLGLVESDIPITTLYYYSNSSDGAVLMEAANDIVGSLASSASIAITEDSTVGTIYYEDGNSQVFSGSKGKVIDLTGGGSQNDPMGVRVIANKPIIGAGQADSDGSDSESFWPVEKFDNDYILPADSQYFIVYCIENVNLTITNADGSFNDSAICTPAFNHPGRVAKGDGTVVTYSAGTRITGDAPFYFYYEYSNQDETNATSWKHARAYMYPEPVLTIGNEQNWN